MSVIIRLQNLPLSASSIDIRSFFRGLSIPDGGVHIVGGRDGDAFIAFSTDEDARQAMALSGNNLKELPVKLLLSSRNEMFKIIEQARQRALGLTPTEPQLPGNSSTPNTNIGSSNSDMNSHSSSQTLNNSGTNSSLDISASRDLNHTNVSVPANNEMQTMGMGMTGFQPGGLGMNMNVQGNMPGFPSMKLPPGMNPQQMSSGLLPGTNPMNNVFSTGGMQQNNPFMMPNMNLNSAQNPMQMAAGMGFPGMMSHLMNSNLPHGMQMPGMLNQIMNPNITASVPTNNGPNNGNSLPGPFNNANAGSRVLPNNIPGHGQNFGLQQPGFPGQGGQGQPTNMMNNPAFDNGHGPQLQGMSGRPGFNAMQPNIMSPHVSAQHNQNQNNSAQQLQNQQLARNRINMNSNEGQKSGFQGGMGSRAGTGPPPGSNPDFGLQGRGGDRGRDRDMNRDKEPILLDRSRPDKIVKRRSPDRRDSARAERRKRSRSRSRDREILNSRRISRESRRPRSTKSRSRSRSRTRGDRSERSSRPSSARDGKPAVPAKIDSDSRNSSGNTEPDLIIVEHVVAQEFPCIKITGVPKEASFREIKEFIRADVRGGGEGLLRNVDDGIVLIRLEKSLDFDKVLRNTGKKICGAVVRVEGIPVDKWEAESKSLKRDRDRERDSQRDRERDRERERPSRPEPAEREPRERIRDGTDLRNDLRDGNDSRGRDRERPADAKECCLRIQGLPPAYSGKDVAMTTLQGVRKYAYSDIHVHVEPVDMNGRSYATAFVKFSSSGEAEKAIAVLKMQGNHLRAEVMEVEELYRIRDAANKSRLGRNPDTKPVFDVEIGKDVESTMVVLKGVPPNMSERDVFDFFSDIGLSPVNVRMQTDPHGNRTGQVLCEFKDPSQARRATTKDGMVFGRSIISVNIVPRNAGPGEMRGGPNMRGGHRPGVLGNPPGPGFVPNPRFHNQSAQSANPFVQELIAQTHHMNGPGGPHGGPRGRGGPRMRGGRGGPAGHRPSRFTPADSTTNDIGGEGHGGPDLTYFDRPDCIVAVTNIPFSATMDDILEFLVRTLEKPVQRDRIIRRYNEFKKATGDARISFPTPFEAQEAYELLKGSVMWNRPLQVSILTEAF